MNGRKPTCFSLALVEDKIDLPDTLDGMMFLPPDLWYNETLWKQLSINFVVDELSAIWGFVYSSQPTKNVVYRGSLLVIMKAYYPLTFKFLIICNSLYVSGAHCWFRFHDWRLYLKNCYSSIMHMLPSW